jgi:hypothetical protein
MILEELVGTFLSLFSTVITQAPAISHENLQNELEEETPKTRRSLRRPYTP